MPIVHLGKPPSWAGTTPVKKHGTIENVSAASPAIVEISFHRSVWIHRVFVRRTAPFNSGKTDIKLYDKDPSGVTNSWNLVYWDDGFDSDKALDDVRVNVLYTSEDHTDRIWLKVTPEAGTSNFYEYLIIGLKMAEEA